MVAVNGWLEQDELIHACRAMDHVFCQPFEVFQVFMDTWVQGDLFAFDVVKGFLHLAKQSSSGACEPSDLHCRHVQAGPYLRRPKVKLLAYVDVFIDDFLGLTQRPWHRR